MDRILSKNLDRIRRYSEKGQLEKALQLLDDQLKSHPNHRFLRQEETRISLMLPNWSELLRRLKESLTQFRFDELVKNEARLKFMDLFRETPAFRGALMDHLLNAQAFDQVADLVQLAEPGDQSWMAKRWVQLGQDIQDEKLAANWQIAAGIANFYQGDWDMAWSLWTLALKADPRSLKKIMSICQKSQQMEMSQLNHRLKIIRLINAAGRREEAISLLHALGMERKENALQVLIEIPHLLSEHLKTLEVSRLRFNLAIFLQDGEIISNVVKHMTEFDDDDLFAFQKQAFVNLEDKDFKRGVLLQMARVYMAKESWESAASLLESLHEEDDHPEIVAAMEEVLEHYPILPNMHLNVAKYQIQNRMKGPALKHLVLIKEVGEFHETIKKMLLDELQERFEPDYAHFLLEILPDDSDLKALIAWAILHFGKEVERADIDKITAHAPKKDHSPFWLLSLAQATLQLLRPQKTVEAVASFLRKYPDLSPEVLRFAETLIDLPGVDLRRLLKVIDESAEQLNPRDLWILLPRQIEFRITTASDRVATATSDQPQPDAIEPPSLQEPESTDQSLSSTFAKELHEITAFAEAGEFRAAAQLAERLAEQHASKSGTVLSRLEHLSQTQGPALVWEKSRMHILVRSEAYDEAIALGEQLLEQNVAAKDQPAIHQLMAFAHDGRGDSAQALNFLCRSSRDPRYYQRNQRQFFRLVFPDNLDLLPKVLDLVISNDDPETWSTLMQAWRQHAPEAVEEQLKWNTRFADRIKQSSVYLDVAHQAAATNRISDAHAALAKIDFKEPHLQEPLLRIVDLVKLKAPKDVSAPFTLGRYYLVQDEIPKAVDVFRALIREIPETGKKVYSYLKKFLEIHVEHQGNIALCGLMIRIALDLDLLLEALGVLKQLSGIDAQGAQSLAGGVYRVIATKDHNREAIFAYLELLDQWGDHETLLDVLAKSDFGRHMTDQRFIWLQRAAEDPSLRDRANLATARLQFELQDFEACYETLKTTGDEIKGEALPLYQELIKRLPKDPDLHREAGWVFWRCGQMQQARANLQQVITHGTGAAVLEAHALLCELSECPDFSDIVAKSGLDEDQALRRLQEIYCKIRGIELDRWHEEGGSVPIEALSWLLLSGEMEAFDRHYGAMQAFISEDEKVIFDARREWVQGQPYYAALHLLESTAPIPVKRSALASAGLLEKAFLLKDPDQEPIPFWLKERFLNTFGKPNSIVAQHALLRGRIQSHSEEPPPAEQE